MSLRQTYTIPYAVNTMPAPIPDGMVAPGVPITPAIAANIAANQDTGASPAAPTFAPPQPTATNPLGQQYLTFAAQTLEANPKLAIPTFTQWYSYLSSAGITSPRWVDWLSFLATSTPPTGSGTAPAPAPSLTSTLASVPWYYWAGGAAAALLLFSGSGNRR